MPDGCGLAAGLMAGGVITAKAEGGYLLPARRSGRAPVPTALPAPWGAGFAHGLPWRWLSRITALTVLKRPADKLEGVGHTWLKWVFSRPGPQEPKKGLPGPAGENPNRPLEKKRPRAQAKGDGRLPGLRLKSPGDVTLGTMREAHVRQ